MNSGPAVSETTSQPRAAVPALAGERVLATVGGWRLILTLNSDSSFNRCILHADQYGQVLQVANNAEDFSVSVPASGHKNGADGTIGVNGNQPEHFRFTPTRDRAWTVMSWDMSQLFETARTIEVGIGNREFQWKLRHTEKAVIRLTDCVNEYAP
ncbi:hypothetical protein [Ancylobacter sp. FA202]|uniref:hypothetical protein n=1 Tax=Ancylobacter sp. FA202 TaxID=1111106 RepID=UPI00036E29F7|nr:hypothetical protein [Ancylobacter sp. FA202]